MDTNYICIEKSILYLALFRKVLFLLSVTCTDPDYSRLIVDTTVSNCYCDGIHFVVQQSRGGERGEANQSQLSVYHPFLQLPVF